MKPLKTLFTLLLIGIVAISQSQTIEISGLVTNLETGEYIANHKVYFSNQNNTDTLIAITDSEGAFVQTIEFNPLDSVLITVSTEDPCYGYMHYDYVMKNESSHYVFFGVCQKGLEPDSCAARFQYYRSFTGDSLESGIDSIGPNVFSFIDMSIGNPTQWLWDFGDGETATEQNPFHTYETLGLYDVTLTISGDNCQSSITQTINLNDTIEEPCIAYFGYDIYRMSDSVVIDSGINDVFHAMFSDFSTGNPNFWHWDFGDGSYSSEQNPEHNYSEAGVYSVTLLMASDNCSDSITLEVNVGNIDQECHAMFYYEYTAYLDSTLINSVNNDLLTLSFTDMSYGEVESWYWDFGDGETATEQNPQHSYETMGTYDVTLTISGDNCQSSITQTINPNDTIEEPCIAYFGYDIYRMSESVVIDSGVNDVFHALFSDFSTGNPNFWYWDFGDGSYSSEQNPEHNYSEAGLYSVTLLMASDNCSDSITLEINVGNIEQGCQAMFYYEFTAYLDSTFIDSVNMDMLTLNFTDMSYGEIESWYWDFGDGETSTEQNPQHTFAEPGDYLVSLQIESDNCQSIYEQHLLTGNFGDTIWYENCVAMFFPVNFEDYTVEFINESLGDIDSYTWDFGDGSGSTQKNPTHTYSNKGEYIVILTIESDSLCMSSTRMSVWVDDFNSDSTVVALFMPEIDGKQVKYFNQSQGDLLNWHWDFGDGSTDKTKNPVHIYDELGTYIVTLGVGNANIVNTFTMEIDLDEGTYIGYFNNGTTDINHNKELIQGFQVYPNPVENVASIVLNSNVSTWATISLINLDGKILSNSAVALSKGQNTFSINTNELNKGIYLIQVNMEMGEIKTLKIVK